LQLLPLVVVLVVAETQQFNPVKMAVQVVAVVKETTLHQITELEHRAKEIMAAMDLMMAHQQEAVVVVVQEQ
jgi:uncharacterized protein YbbC (DUF1343 family)